MPRGTILLVEDDKGYREACKEYLEIRDYIVIACENSWEALETIDGGLVFDLALVDLHLPEPEWDGYRSFGPSVKAGYDLVKEIKKRDQKKPIIVMSGYDEPPSKLRQFCLEYPSGREGITFFSKEDSINLIKLIDQIYQPPKE